MIKYHSSKVKSAELKVLKIQCVARVPSVAELKERPQVPEYRLTQIKRLLSSNAGAFTECESTKYFLPYSALSKKLCAGVPPVEQTSVTQHSALSKVNWLVVEE